MQFLLHFDTLIWYYFGWSHKIKIEYDRISKHFVILNSKNAVTVILTSYVKCKINSLKIGDYEKKIFSNLCVQLWNKIKLNITLYYNFNWMLYEEILFKYITENRMTWYSEKKLRHFSNPMIGNGKIEPRGRCIPF